MAKEQKLRWGAAVVAAPLLIAAVVLWIAPGQQISSAQDGGSSPGPLISRGFTDAPEGTAVVAGETAAGSVVLEMRVVEGQKVKRGEIIAVLSNYPIVDTSMHTAEAKLEKAKRQREAMVSGYRLAKIAQQEVVVKTSNDENKLKALELQRSGMPPDQKQLEINISRQKLEREQAKLKVMKETLATDITQNDTDISILAAKLDNARTAREQALVRSPLDGIVVQVYTHQGEPISGRGITKIVDMSQLRVLTDVDEIHLNRIIPGGKVEVTFRGNPTIYRGKIARVAPTVKRMQRIQPEGASATDSRLVQVEIQLDDPSRMPQMLGRETRVTFF